MINILFFSVVIAMVLAYYIAPKKKNIPSDGNKPLPGPKGIPYFGMIRRKSRAKSKIIYL